MTHNTSDEVPTKDSDYDMSKLLTPNDTFDNIQIFDSTV